MQTLNNKGTKRTQGGRKNIIKQCSLSSMALISSVKYARLSKNLAFIFCLSPCPSNWMCMNIPIDNLRPCPAAEPVFLQKSSVQVSKWMKYLLLTAQTFV